jgi:hypothetical protein
VAFAARGAQVYLDIIALAMPKCDSLCHEREVEQHVTKSRLAIEC